MEENAAWMNNKKPEDVHFLRSILEQAPMGYCSLWADRKKTGSDDEFLVLDANEAVGNILGIDTRAAIGRPVTKILEVLNDEDEVIWKALNKVSDGKEAEVVTYYDHKNNKWLKISFYSPESGQIVAFVSDITAAMAKFSDLDIFFNITPDILAISTMDGQYIKVNPAWEKELGYKPEEVIGKYAWNFLNPEDGQDKNTLLDARRTGREPVKFVNRCRHKDGSYRYIEWDAQSDGEQIYAIGRDITKRMVWEKKIEYISYHDTLTGLYNRRFMDEEIKRIGKSRILPITVIMGDVNRLKLINDAFGHEKGDELIIKAAEAIRSSCRPEDLIARWGGDEFMIFLPETGAEDAARIVERIHGHCARQQVNAIDVSISFGIAIKQTYEEDVLDTMREAENAMYRAKGRESERSRKDIIQAVMGALYEREPLEENHAKRVSVLCRRTAQHLGCDAEEIKRITMAGLLHDIGKVSVNIQILEKPSQLTEAEWAEVRKHAEVGCRVIGSAQEMINVGNAILAHHERMDGKGYPEGIQWEDVPTAARIIAIADSYDTMTNQSVYREKMTKEMAIEEIRQNEGTQFDPKIAELFIEKVLLDYSE